MSERYHGRLELTWTNKDLSLLAHEDGSYEWVPPTDYRVAEVRLLREAGVVGDLDGPHGENLLVRGDALSALHSLSTIPSYADRYVGQVRLAYLDPPFNTQQSFLHYDDALEHSVWLTMMRDRLLQIRRLLAANGSVWVHCDDYEQAHLRVLLDEVFARSNFVSTIVWEKAQGAKGDTDISSAHDFILVYAKDKAAWKQTRNLLPRTENQTARYKNPDNDPRGPWRQYADGTAKSGDPETNRFDVTLPSGRVVQPPKGAYWRFSKETLEKARAEGRVYFGRDGDGMPVIKQYLSEVKDGVVPKSWWPATEVGSNQEAKRDHLRRLFPDVELFATPKPERLMHRIIHIASDPEDLVLDCFAGSGTTAAVAHKMGRRWIAIERSSETLDAFAIPRLTMVTAGQDPGGITDHVGWEGGGGFQILDVGPSMFEDDEGVVMLAEWAVNSALAEATAAQLGYGYEPDAPFCGRKGRSRLAVIDGLVNPTVIELLLGALDEGEQLTVCGTSVDPEAAEKLRGDRPGSRVRKIPSSLLTEYQEATRWRPRLVEPAAASSDGKLPAAIPFQSAGRA